MFLPPQCSLGGEIPSLGINSFSSLHCDPRGAVWAVDGSGTRVFCFSGTMISEMMSSSVMTTSVEPSNPIFECNEGDRILSIVFPTIGGGGQQVFVCIATVNGCLVLCDADSPELVLHQCELESHITAVTAVPISDKSKTQNHHMTGVVESPPVLITEDTANGASVLVSFFDENFSEVVLVEWGGDEEGVSATGLFRIRGRLHSIMMDEMCERIVTVAQRGDVDVWNWRRSVDETLIFGMPSYNIEMYGEPSSCTLVRGERLWIGTTTGHIVVFQLLLPHTPTTTSLANNNNNNNNNNNMEKDGKAPQYVWQAHLNGSAVRSLLVMSLGRHMWSYGEDQQALVWDAVELTLQGSFQFPGNGLMALCGGERYTNTTLWGVNASAGTATWFVVKEPLLCDERSSLLRRDECIVKREEAERFYVLDLLVSHLCSMLQLDQEDEEEEDDDYDDHNNNKYEDAEEGMKDMKTKSEQRRRKDNENGEDGVGRVRHNNNNNNTLATPPHLDVALQQLQNDQPTMRLLPPAIASLIVGQRMLQRSLIEDGLYSMSFLEDLRQLLQLRRQHRELESQVQRCLNGLNELLPPNELCESIEDVVETTRTFIQAGKTSTSIITSPMKMTMNSQQLQQLNSHRRSKSLEDTPPPPPPPPLMFSHLNHTNTETIIPGIDNTITTTTNTNTTNTAAVMRGGVLLPDSIETHHAHIRQLEEELIAERRRREELEVQCTTAEDERREMQQQLTRAHRLQEDYESRTTALERALKVAKRAAAVPAAGATRLCELESSLLKANRTVEELQLKVETLTRGQEQMMQEHTSLQTRLHRYKVKEQLAKRAFANFIETQNHVLDKLEDMLQQPTSKGSTYNYSDRNNSETTPADVETLYDWLCARIEQQRETHAGLRHSYMQQSEGEGKEWEVVSISSTTAAEAEAASVSCVK